MEQLKRIILKDRYSLLVTTIVIYMAVLMLEGLLTGREARVIDLETPISISMLRTGSVSSKPGIHHPTRPEPPNTP